MLPSFDHYTNQKEAKIMFYPKSKRSFAFVILAFILINFNNHQAVDARNFNNDCGLCLDDYELESVPMIDAFEGLAQRADDAFAELDAAFDDDLKAKRQAERQAKQAERQAKQAERQAMQAEKQAKQAERQAKQAEKQAKQAEKQAKQAERQAKQAERQAEKRVRRNRQATQQTEISRFEAEILRLVNQERAKGGYCADEYFQPASALHAQRQLAKAARHHGLAMSRSHFFSHYGKAGDTPKDRIIATGYQGNAWGENIAAGQKTPQQVMQEWMDSPGHCRNILNGLFNELGVSFIFDTSSPYKTYWVQAFGRSN